MWAGPLHDRAFVESMLAHVQNNKGDFGTATRLEGMLGLAREVRGGSLSAIGLVLTDVT